MSHHTIWKFDVPIEDFSEIKMSKGARILSVADQGEEPNIRLWALVDPEAETESKFFRVIGTGNPIYGDTETLKFIGTVVVEQLGLVWHVFGVIE